MSLTCRWVSKVELSKVVLNSNGRHLARGVTLILHTRELPQGFKCKREWSDILCTTDNKKKKKRNRLWFVGRECGSGNKIFKDEWGGRCCNAIVLFTSVAPWRSRRRLNNFEPLECNRGITLDYRTHLQWKVKDRPGLTVNVLPKSGNVKELLAFSVLQWVRGLNTLRVCSCGMNVFPVARVLIHLTLNDPSDIRCVHINMSSPRRTYKSSLWVHKSRDNCY